MISTYVSFQCTVREWLNFGGLVVSACLVYVRWMIFIFLPSLLLIPKEISSCKPALCLDIMNLKKALVSLAKKVGNRHLNAETIPIEEEMMVNSEVDAYHWVAAFVVASTYILVCTYFASKKKIINLKLSLSSSNRDEKKKDYTMTVGETSVTSMRRTLRKVVSHRNVSDKSHRRFSTVQSYVQHLGGDKSIVIEKVLIANNGVAAVKAIRSMRKWAYEVFGDERAIKFVVMATPEDLRYVKTKMSPCF